MGEILLTTVCYAIIGLILFIVLGWILALYQESKRWRKVAKLQRKRNEWGH